MQLIWLLAAGAVVLLVWVFRALCSSLLPRRQRLDADDLNQAGHRRANQRHAETRQMIAAVTSPERCEGAYEQER